MHGEDVCLGCQLLFPVSYIFLPIYSNFSTPAVFLSIPVITAVICSQERVFEAKKLLLFFTEETIPMPVLRTLCSVCTGLL